MSQPFMKVLKMEAQSPTAEPMMVVKLNVLVMPFIQRMTMNVLKVSGVAMTIQ